MSEKNTVQLNGELCRLKDVPDSERLLDSIRWRWGLRGTKEGCRTGDCGACTVLVDDETILSCLTLTHELEGRSIVTVEGIEGTADGRRVRAAFSAEDAAQCGYCTPGFVMALLGALRSSEARPTGEELREALQGNLCRCTGYGSILRASRRLVERR